MLYLPTSRGAPSCILMRCVSCDFPRARLSSFVDVLSPLLLQLQHLVLPLLRWSRALLLRLQLFLLCYIFGAFAQAGGQPHAAFFAMCRRRRRTHPPARPSYRAQCPVPSWLLPRSRATGSRAPRSVLVCVGAAAAGVLGGAWYGFAVAPRRTSSDHAIHVCATGAVGTYCAPRRCVGGPQAAWPGWRFGSSGRV